MKKWFKTYWFDFLFVILLVLTWASLSSESFGPLAGHHKNNKGIVALTTEMYNMAEKNFLEVLRHDSYNPVARVNLGITYEIAKKYDRAYKEYSSLLRIKNLKPELAFISQFNAGNASAGEQKIDKALMHYQNALEVIPGHEDARKNIEMLFLGQQGKGKGKGNSDSEKKQEGDGEGEDPRNDPNSKPSENQNQTPKDEFQGKDLTEQDVRKILEELKSQEQKIRALDYEGKKGKEKAPDKDW
jgi:Ca-activated chloride channel family protein